MPEGKPPDFLLGLTEFFAILLPGAALVYLADPWLGPLIPAALRPADPTAGAVVFAGLAYVAGHILHAFGGKLDRRAYDNFYLKRRQPDHYAAVRAQQASDAKGPQEGGARPKATLYGRVCNYGDVDASGTSHYDWCLGFVRLHSAAAAAEVDRCQADSKFFRSFAVVLLLLVLGSPLHRSPVVAVAALGACAFSLWRYFVLRWEATKRVYEYYLLLRSAEPGSRREPARLPG